MNYHNAPDKPEYSSHSYRQVVDLVDLFNTKIPANRQHLAKYQFDECRIRSRLGINAINCSFSNSFFINCKYEPQKTGAWIPNAIQIYEFIFDGCVFENIQFYVDYESYNTLWRPMLEGAQIDNTKPLPDIEWN